MKEHEPAVRMAKGHIQEAVNYLGRLPETPGLHRVLKDLAESQDRLNTYATKVGIDLKESMPT